VLGEVMGGDGRGWGGGGALTAARTGRKRGTCRAVPSSSGAVGHRSVERLSEWSFTCLVVLRSRILCCCTSARERSGKAAFVVVRYISAGISTGPLYADSPEAHDWAEPERFE